MWYKLDLLIDEGHVADSLRELANYIEECEEIPTQFETFHCCGEISEEY